MPPIQPPKPLSPGERVVLKTGLMCAAVGFLGLLLPLFGLQLRKFSAAGDKSTAVAAGCLVLGVVLSAGVYARRHLKWVRIGLGAIAVLFAGFPARRGRGRHLPPAAWTPRR